MDYRDRVCGQKRKEGLSTIALLTEFLDSQPTRNLPVLPHNNQIRKLLLLRQLHKVLNLILSPSLDKLARRKDVAEFLDEFVQFRRGLLCGCDEDFGSDAVGEVGCELVGFELG